MPARLRGQQPRDDEDFSSPHGQRRTSPRTRISPRQTDDESDGGTDRESILESPLNSSRNYRGTSLQQSEITKEVNKLKAAVDDLTAKVNILMAAVGAISLVVVFSLILPNIGELPWGLFSGVGGPTLAAARCVKLEKLAELDGFFSGSLREDFPTQSSQFWRVIQSNIRSTVRDHRPSCIVLPAHQKNPESYKAVTTLSRRLECAFTGSSDALVLQGVKFSGPTGQTRLDSQLSTWFDSGKRVAVINNIDGFEVDTASAFYKFCDDNADPLYPDTVLLLTVDYDVERGSNEERQLQNRPSEWLDRRLREKWSNDDDVITPLLSRVANSVAVVQN